MVVLLLFAQALAHLGRRQPERRRLLLERFGSLAGVRSATVRELATVEGVSPRLAERILDHLGRTS